MSQYKKLKKEGWNWYAFFFNVIWYYKYSMIDKGIIMTVFILLSLGFAVLPIAIYCGAKGNRDRYEAIKKNLVN